MEAASPPAGRTPVLYALRHRDFRLLWAGQCVSLLGDAAFLVALGWRAFTLAGAGRLGIVLALQGTGLLATLLLGGALADRYQRRTLMIVSDLSRFAIVAALAVVDGSGALTFPLLCVFATSVGLANGFFHPAFGGIVPLVVEKPSLPSANVLIGLARQGSLMLGPLLAAGLYPAAGSATVFAVDAASFLVSAALLWQARPRVMEPQPGEGTVREIVAGARYVASVPWLWVTIALFSLVVMLQVGPAQVLLPKLVRQHFGLGVGAYGLLTSLLGAGFVIGLIAFGKTNPRRNRGVVSYVLWLSSSLMIVGVALSPWFALSAAFTLGRGVIVGYAIAVWETMLMEMVPEQMLSRVVSLDFFGSFGLMPLGLLLAGVVSGLASPGAIIAGGAVISAGLIVVVLTRPWLRAVH
jgi:MFS family permease